MSTGKQKENMDKLFAECKRLAQVAQEGNAIIKQKETEYENFKNEYKNHASNDDVGELEALRQELNANKAEIQYLESQLKKREEENLQLKAEKQILMEDMGRLGNANQMQASSETIVRYE